MSAQQNLMIEGSIPKKILAFAFPLFIGNLFQQLYNTADSLIVGNFVGSSALAAVSSAGNLIFLITGFFIGLSVGAGVVISTYLGAGKKLHVKLAVHTSIALGILCSILMTFIGVVFAPQALLLMGTPKSVLYESVVYFRIYFWGATGMVMYNTFVAVLQSAGDSKHPLYYLIISSIINVVLDLLFIKVMHYGVGAAALATTISQFISAILALVRLLKTDSLVKLVIKDIKFNPFMLRKIIKTGLPSAFQNSIIGFANVVVQTFVNYFGQMAIAGIGAYSKIEGFVFLPITSFAMALTTFVGQNVGAKRFDRVKKGTIFGLTCSMATAEFIGIIMFFFSDPMIAAFDSNPSVVFYGTQRSKICALFFFALAFSHISASHFRGIGKSTTPMFVMLICWCIIRVLILFVCGYVHPSILTTHWVYPITWILSSIMFIWMFIKENEKNYYQS